MSIDEELELLWRTHLQRSVVTPEDLSTEGQARRAKMFAKLDGVGALGTFPEKLRTTLQPEEQALWARIVACSTSVPRCCLFRVPLRWLFDLGVNPETDPEELEENQDRGEHDVVVSDLLSLLVGYYAKAVGHFLALAGNKDPTPYHQSIVRGVLVGELKREPTGREVDELARCLNDSLQDAYQAIKFGSLQPLPREVEIKDILAYCAPEEEGMLLWDAKAARFLDGIGDKGKDLAKALRKEAKKRWGELLQDCNGNIEEGLFSMQLASIWALSWTNKDVSVTPLRFAWNLARALWYDQVEPRLKRERAKPKALVFPVFEEAIDAHTPGGLLQAIEGNNALINHRGERVSDLRRIKPLDKVPTLELSVLPKILSKGAKLLGTLNAYRLLHLEVSLGHQRALNDDIKDVRALRFEGGWEALAEAAGIEGNSRAISEVHAIIAAQAHLCWRWPDGTYGNLLSYEVRPARRNQRGRVSLILGDALLPDFIFTPGFFGNGRTAREARRLVPMLPLPPLIGRDNDKGAQVNLQLRLLVEMRRRAGEFYEKGGILLEQDKLEEFAKEATLPLSTLSKVIERWTQDGDDGPALLERIERDRYTLGKTHVDARNFIAKAGEEEIQGKEAGLKSRELDSKRSKKITPHG
jgi:hypothetical protein